MLNIRSIIACIVSFGFSVFTINGYAEIAKTASSSQDIVNAVNEVKQAVEDNKSYYASVEAKKSAADAEMIYMSSPSKEIAENLGTMADFIESETNVMMLKEELSNLNWSLYSTTPGGKYEDFPEGQFYDAHKQYFCSKNSGIKGVSCTNTSQMEHANIKISSLLNPLQYDETQEFVAKEVIRNFSYPFPNMELRNLLAQGIKTPGDKRKAAALMLGSAIFNVAQNSLNEMHAMRLPSGSENNKSSLMNIIATESSRRFKDKNWHNAVQEASQEAMLREMLNIEAFKLWMDYYRYRQNERIEALLAILMTKDNINNEIIKTQTRQGEIVK